MTQVARAIQSQLTAVEQVMRRTAVSSSTAGSEAWRGSWKTCCRNLMRTGMQRLREDKQRGKGSRALKKCRRDQQKYPRVPAQALLVIMAPDGTVRVSMSKEFEEHSQVKRATELLTTSLEHLVAGQGTTGPVS